eukprot:13757653-Heterocapsa_arctica.AAC.1
MTSPTGEDVAENVTEEAVRDEGTSKRKIYANTSRPVGIPTEVWKKMSQAEKSEVIRRDKIHAGKGEGAGASTETGGPTDAAVAHMGG